MMAKPEALRWTSTYKAEDRATLKVENRHLAWDLPFIEVFEVLGYRFHRDGQSVQGADRTLCKGVGSWWRDGYIYRSKCLRLKTKRQRVVSHVFGTALNGSVNWPWSVTTCASGNQKSCVSLSVLQCTRERVGLIAGREQRGLCV